jgi:recombination protein RecA
MTITRKVKEPETLSKQVERRVNRTSEKKEESTITENKGNFDKGVISTGSTLANLAISGGRIRGGGLPGGIFVEIYGPESSGKSALLCEIAGDIQRKGGEMQFDDPEGRLDYQFSQMFGVTINKDNYSQPNTVTAVFQSMNKWKPKNLNVINGKFTDSLAALSTDLEMEKDEGDKMGGRRGKEFSEQLRKYCRKIKELNYLMVCSNQLRDTFATYGPKEDSPGGKAIRFYASLRLKTRITKKLEKTKTINGKEVSRIIGVDIELDVVKSSIWKPYHSAPITIIFDYGIDNLRQNLQFLKDYTKATTYVLGGEKVAVSMDDAIRIIERDGLQHQLEEEVIDLWEFIENNFVSDRKPKR